MMTQQTVSQLVARLTDAYEDMPDDVTEPVTGEPTTIAECVPLIAITLELLHRGPTSISIESVESYRTKVLQLLAQIQPAIEREAKLSLADWTDSLDQAARRAA